MQTMEERLLNIIGILEAEKEELKSQLSTTQDALDAVLMGDINIAIVQEQEV